MTGFKHDTGILDSVALKNIANWRTK